MAKRAKKTRPQIKAFLRGKKHKAADVNTQIDSKTAEGGLIALHGVSVDEYRGAGGKAAL
jgi:hypothetical protein